MAVKKNLIFHNLTLVPMYKVIVRLDAPVIAAANGEKYIHTLMKRTPEYNRKLPIITETLGLVIHQRRDNCR